MHGISSLQGGSASLEQLFAGNHCSQEVVFRVISRQGSPRLFLPAIASTALETLSLYPAQTRLARLAKAGLAVGLRYRLPLPLRRVRLDVDPSAPFLHFLAQFTTPGRIPLWGMMAGNPNAPGQRLIFLVFDDQLKPRAVVKVGLSAEAQCLIAKEAAMLASLPAGIAGATPFLGAWEDEGVTKAFALPFISAGSPSADSIRPLAALLHDWLRHGSAASLSAIPEWEAMGRSEVGTRLLASLPPSVGSAVVQAPVAHGDLAPWNIKADGDQCERWTVIDWERGTLRGVPAWDWFHYILQPTLLVEKCGAEALVERAKGMLESEPFRQYAKAAQIEGLERALLLGYLVYCTEVIRQGEGRETLVSAREILSRAWGVAD